MLSSLLKSRLTSAILIGLACLLCYLTVDRGRIDVSGPFFLEFGRGSGWHGLNTVKVRPDGIVVLHRRGDPGSWEMTTLKLPEDSLAQVRDAIARNPLPELGKEYHGDAVDGVQWVLLIEGKAVYFDNNFPDAIVRFAESLEQVLHENGLDKAEWRRVPSPHAGKHDRALWDSLKR